MMKRTKGNVGSYQSTQTYVITKLEFYYINNIIGLLFIPSIPKLISNVFWLISMHSPPESDFTIESWQRASGFDSLFPLSQ